MSRAIALATASMSLALLAACQADVPASLLASSTPSATQGETSSPEGTPLSGLTVVQATGNSFTFVYDLVVNRLGPSTCMFTKQGEVDASRLDLDDQIKHAAANGALPDGLSFLGDLTAVARATQAQQVVLTERSERVWLLKTARSEPSAYQVPDGSYVAIELKRVDLAGHGSVWTWAGNLIAVVACR